LITLIGNDFNSNSELKITMREKKKLLDKKKRKYKLYKQIQDPR